MTINQPGALNVIVFFTDGQPNGLTFDFTGSNPNSILPIMTQSDSRYGTGNNPYNNTNQCYTMPASSCSVGSAPMGVLAQWGGNANGPHGGPYECDFECDLQYKRPYGIRNLKLLFHK